MWKGKIKMEKYKLRLIQEYGELNSKITRLSSVVKKHEEGKLPEFDLNYPIEILKSQLHTMIAYSQILELRGKLDGLDLELESKLPTEDEMREWDRKSTIENSGGFWLDQD